MGFGDRASAHLRPLVGFACNQGFVFSLFYMGANRALGIGPVSFERGELFGTLLFMVCAFMLLRLVSRKVRDALLARPLIWCYAALLVVGSVVPAVAGSAAALGLVAECALVGLPAGLMLAAWGRALGVRPALNFVTEVVGGSAVGAATCLAAALVPVEGALLALKLLPLGSAWALRSLMRPPLPGVAAGASGHGAAAPSATGAGAVGCALPAPGAPEPAANEAARLSAKVVAGTMLFGVAAGFMETYSSDPGMLSNPTLPASLLFFVLFCVAAFQMIGSAGEGRPDAPAAPPTGASASQGMSAGDAAAKAGGLQCLHGPRAAADRPGPLDDTYRLAVLVMMAGFLFVPVLGDFGIPGEAVVLAGYLGLSAVLTCLFLVIAQLTGRDAALSFSNGFTALFCGEMAGVALGNVLDMLEPSAALPYASVACAGLAVLFAYLFLFTERDFRALSIIAEAADRFEDACRRIAASAGLSKREAEVLPLALRGRTGERIAAELCISKSTVDTHLRRIYAKCEVHSRQELIDLGERTARELSGTASKGV